MPWYFQYWISLQRATPLESSWEAQLIKIHYKPKQWNTVWQSFIGKETRQQKLIRPEMSQWLSYYKCGLRCCSHSSGMWETTRTVYIPTCMCALDTKFNRNIVLFKNRAPSAGSVKQIVPMENVNYSLFDATVLNVFPLYCKIVVWHTGKAVFLRRHFYVFLLLLAFVNVTDVKYFN